MNNLVEMKPQNHNYTARNPKRKKKVGEALLEEQDGAEDGFSPLTLNGGLVVLQHSATYGSASAKTSFPGLWEKTPVVPRGPEKGEIPT